MIRGKGGIMRIIEAFIAILIIASVAIFIYVNQIQRPNTSEEINKLGILILDKISYDNDLRQAVIYGESNKIDDAAIGNRSIINNSIYLLVPSGFVYEFRICDLDILCGLEHGSEYYTKNEIYTMEKSISSTLKGYSPKKIRLFIWQK